MQKLNKHPRIVLTAMATILILSTALSFTVLRNRDPAEKKGDRKSNRVHVVSDGFDQISHTAAAIQKTIQLKNRIDSLSTKQILSRQDSITLEQDLDQLRHLQNQQKP